MKKAIRALFVLLFLILTVSGALAAEKMNKPEIKTVDNYIAVFDFEVTTGDKGISRPLTESVRRELVMSGKYEVIDRGNMNKILDEQKFQMSGCVTGECIVEAGQILGVGKLISGTVSMVGKTYYLTLSLISVKTGKIENVAEDTCKCEVDELLGSTKRLAKRLLSEKVEQPAATAPKPATMAIAKPAEPEPKFATATIVPSAVNLTIVARDGRFEKLVSGVVCDTQSGLEWYAGPDKNTGWDDANKWAAGLRVDGGGWRMPTLEELKGLYQKGAGSRNMTSLLKTTGWWIWSGETRSSMETSAYGHSAAAGVSLDFDGGTELLDKRVNSSYKRGFAVRSRR
jgi:hypothetical protein